MLRRFQLIRNVGRFDSFTGDDSCDLGPLSVVYADNARGKTTLCGILRSLRDGDPEPIMERSRVGADRAPHVVVTRADGSDHVFEDGAWDEAFPGLWIFDDTFVDDNVYSGLAVEAGHRQGLHQVIIGRQGVQLAREVADLTDRISDVRKEIKEAESQFPRELLAGRSVSDFCALPEIDELEDKLDTAAKRVKALGQADEIERKPTFDVQELPSSHIGDIEVLLERSLQDIAKEAFDEVERHIATLDSDSEEWVAEGVRLAQDREDCPFCGQALDEARLLDHYRAYFSEEYATHVAQLRAQLADVRERFSGNRLAAFERAWSEKRDLHRFWSQFVELPPITLDSADVARRWEALRENLVRLIRSKISNPLESLELDEEATTTAEAYAEVSSRVKTETEVWAEANDAIAEVKASTTEADLGALNADLARLQATKARHQGDGEDLCEQWSELNERKSELEEEKDLARQALDEHREAVFPQYEESINEVLARFGAAFRLEGVVATNPGGQPSTQYHLSISGTRVPVDGETGEPQFKNTLSGGDRSTLAFAFFLAALKNEPELDEHVVVIDDPLSSLDAFRSLVTENEIARLMDESHQLVVLSHNKSLLCGLWQKRSATEGAALEVRRSGGSASVLETWDVNSASITDYDRRHERLRQYVREGGSIEDGRRVAADLRPLLEGFLRVASPAHFKPEVLLGQFVAKARTAIENGDESILTASELRELDELREYANQFHHDNANVAQALADLNESQLDNFAGRVLTFISPTGE